MIETAIQNVDYELMSVKTLAIKVSTKV